MYVSLTYGAIVDGVVVVSGGAVVVVDGGEVDVAGVVDSTVEIGALVIETAVVAVDELSDEHAPRKALATSSGRSLRIHRPYVLVMRWPDAPAFATAGIELVAYGPLR